MNKLTKEQSRVMRECGTEAPFSGKYVTHKEDGNYYCAFCGNKLFDSKVKFDSGTGWPSFRDVVKGSVRFLDDNGATEVRCSKCDSHLGHVFNELSGKRYCINSVALNFKKR